ncbi:MAG: MMPL family transporter [Deltaproteobacteria bacterium]|nr:MMPL family transporter [Deltaproteobacteria bacterium]
MTTQTKTDRLFAWACRRRARVLAVSLVLVGLFSVGITRMHTDVILQHMFPYDHPYLKLNMKFAQVFGGGGSAVAIAVKAKNGDIFNPETLGKVKKITDEIVLWDEAYRVLTVSIATHSSKVVKTLSKGEISIEALMWPEVPSSPEEMKLLKKHIFSNPAYNGILVSRDGTAALILTQFKENISYERAFQLLRKVQGDFGDAKTSLHVVGYPMLMGWIYSHKVQMYWVFGFSVAFMLAVLFALFRNVVGLVAPLAMAAICTGLGLGFIGWTGINFSPLLYVLAFLIGARMVSNSVQITHRFIEEFHASGDRDLATYETMRAMAMPNLAAVATDVVGFSVLALAKIVLMQQLAILMSFWMATIVLSGTLVPLICSVLPIRKRAVDQELEKEQWLAKLNAAVAAFSVGAGRYLVLLGVLAIVVLGAWQTSKLKVGDPTPGSPILWPNHPYNIDQAVINQTFDASSETFQLFYEGDRESVYDPEVLHTFQAFDRHMATQLPDIYKSSAAIVNMAKMLNVTFHDGDVLWYQLPREEQALTGLLGYIRNSVDRGTLGRFMDGTLERAQITLFFADHTSDNMIRIRDAAYAFFKEHPMKTARGSFHLAGDSVGMEIALNEEMQRSHALMDSLVLIAIFLMCTIAFRSLVAGLMLTLPLVLSNLVAAAYMSLMNIGLSVNTLPCAAVGVGVGVDFAIYLYSRCMEEYPRYRDHKQAVLAAVRTCGKGIVFTAGTLILPVLLWYFVSALKFQAQMGFFLALLLATNMISAFTLHPLLLVLVKPAFIARGAREEKRDGVAAIENAGTVAGS